MNPMVETLLGSPVFGLAATVLVYALAQELQHRYQRHWLNPVLLTLVVLIVGLKLSGVSYARYNHGAQYISFFLAPAVVALGVPLYLQLARLRQEARAVGVSVLVGSVCGIVMGAGLAALLGASEAVVVSLMPRSVSTPIAIAIMERLPGGLPQLTAPLVVMSGLLGMVFGPQWLRALGIRNPRAIGLALGVGSHGLGTSRALAESDAAGAYAGLAMCLCGLTTALLAPGMTPWMLWLVGKGV